MCLDASFSVSGVVTGARCQEADLGQQGCGVGHQLPFSALRSSRGAALCFTAAQRSVRTQYKMQLHHKRWITE